MASYQPTILPAPEQTGFWTGLNSGLRGAGSQYIEAMLNKKRKAAEESDAMKKFESAVNYIKSSGGVPEISYSQNGGYSVKSKEKKEIGLDDIKKSMLGYGSKDIGQELGIPQQQPMNQDVFSKMFPVGNMVGQELNQYGQAVQPEDQYYQSQIQHKYAPGMNEGEITRDILGLSKAPNIRQDVGNDIRMAHDSANGDKAILRKNLEDLMYKYSGDMESIRMIKAIIDEQDDAGSSSSVEDQLKYIK